MKSTQRFWSEQMAATTGAQILLRHAVAAEHVCHFFGFLLRQFHGLAQLALPFGEVMVAIRARRQVSAQAHGDRSRGNFGEAGNDHDFGRLAGAGESGGERERYRKAVRHADHYVANRIGGFEVPLDVWGVRELLNLLHVGFGLFGVSIIIAR